MTGTLSPLLVAGRDVRVRDELARRGAPSVLLVADLNNVRWLTGFTGSAGTLVLRPDDMVFITDGRYGEQARDQAARSAAAVTVVEARSAAALKDALTDATRSASTIAYDPAEVTMAAFDGWRAAINSELVAVPGVVPALRRQKSDAEIERMAFAALCADRALAACVPMLVERPTERDVRDELEYRMRRQGADGPSYDTIVAAGPNAARPHHRPGDHRIVEGDSVVIDVGALVDGYHSDMTRTYLVGDVDPELARMTREVARAQLAGLAAVRAGVTAGDVDRVCRDALRDAGLAELFVHSTGHGVGLQIHEMPWVRTAADEPLRTGEVVTVEPGAYREGLGGVRIEDLVVVTDDGCRILTSTDKDLSCLQLRPTT
jgi:Xaa-Pro aminopeptidase